MGTKLGKKIVARARRSAKHKEPLWKGPEVDGITFSMLSRFLVCRERFRVQVIEGLKPIPTFQARTEYGNMWHLCEECHANRDRWEEPLFDYCSSLIRQYRTQAAEIEKWYNVCKVQFPIYVQYWEEHVDVVNSTPIVQEAVFSVPYGLPGGRKVILRGKWDSVDLVDNHNHKGIVLQENKTKGQIVENQLVSQLRMDMQTMMYLSALKRGMASTSEESFRYSFLPENVRHPICGVRYNVVRRPLSGGKGTIVRHKPTKSNPLGESLEHYYDRLREIIETNPEEFFLRYNITVTEQDITRFEEVFLTPILTQLCDWYLWVANNDKPSAVNPDTMNCIHWTTPFGFYNVLAEGGTTELDEYLMTGNSVGLERVESLFEELV